MTRIRSKTINYYEEYINYTEKYKDRCR